MKGRPNGLRSTCCIARLVMMWWDNQLVVALTRLNIKIISGARYMDDIRIWLHSVRLGWRFMDDKMVFKKSWQEEERQAGMTNMEKTTEILEKVMNSICGWLNLTMENETMFGGTLPTLDLQIWIRDDNKILYKYFEKTMTPVTVLHARSAIPGSTRRATLNQELIRRLTNTSEFVEEELRIGIVDDYAQKLINSEYTLKTTRDFLMGGLKGYERLLSLSKDRLNPKWKPLHMSARWNGKNRRRAKQLAKTNWYKGKVPVEPPPSNHKADLESASNQQEGSEQKYDPYRTGDNTTTSQGVELLRNSDSCCQEEYNKHKTSSVREKKKRRGEKRENITLGGLKRVEKASRRKEKQKINRKMGSMGLPTIQKTRKGPPPPIVGVCFIDNTVNGVLVKRMQEVECVMGEKTNIKVRMTEAAGTPLGVLLTTNNPWGNQGCEREDCVTCNQKDERIIDCKKRNI